MITELKRGIDIVQVVQSAGVDLKKSGSRHIGLCPFHTENTPSFFVFQDNRFKCFGCGESGDVIDFAQKLYGISFPEALRHLGIEKQKPTPAMRQKIKRRKRRTMLVKRFRDWERAKCDELAMLVRCIRKIVKKWKTSADLEVYGQILHMLPLCEYQLALLIFGNDQEKIEFYKEAQNGQIRHRG